jgi:hypothetical protein
MGLPEVNYRPPLVVTLLTSVALFLVLGFFALIVGSTSYVQLDRYLRGEPGGAVALAVICGLAALVCGAAAVFLVTVIIKTIRDLRTPIQYARGAVSDKRSIGGRNVGNWLAVRVRYVGTDVSAASEITDYERARFPDRSQVFQPRYASSARPASPPATKSSYLPAERVKAIVPPPSGAKPKEDDSPYPRIVYRVDPASFSALEPEDEVIVAYSRYLQHIYYVSRIKGGEWETYRNKQLI